MKDWTLELRMLEQKQNDKDAAARLELVADEINELNDLEIEFQNTKSDLTQCRKTLTEMTAKNSPVITELTETLNKLKTDIHDVDVDWKMLELSINNSTFEISKQQTLVKELEASAL